MQHPVDQIRKWSSDFTCPCSRNLVRETSNKWRFIPGNDPQRFLDMKNFTDERKHSLKAATQQAESTIGKKLSNQHLRKFHSNLATSLTTTCEYCNENQKNLKNLKFEALSIRNRAQLMKKKGRCFNSLSPGHCCKHCNGSTLRNCNWKLNSLLLFQANSNPKRASKAPRVPTNYFTTKISHPGMEHSQ